MVLLVVEDIDRVMIFYFFLAPVKCQLVEKGGWGRSGERG